MTDSKVSIQNKEQWDLDWDKNLQISDLENTHKQRFQNLTWFDIIIYDYYTLFVTICGIIGITFWYILFKLFGCYEPYTETYYIMVCVLWSIFAFYAFYIIDGDYKRNFLYKALSV